LISVTNTTSSGFYDGTTWDIPSIIPSTFETLTITGVINSTDSFNNTALVAFAEQADPDTNDLTDTANVTVTFLDLSLTKSVNQTTANLFDPLTFEINVTNAGPFNATNIDIDDPLPSEVSEVSNLPTLGSYTDPIWSIPLLEPGETATLTINVTIITPDNFNNTAEIVFADQFDTDSTNDNQTVSVTVLSADLSLNKTVDQDTVNWNDTVTFTVILNNTGPDNATNIVVTDSNPLVDATNTTSLGTYDGTTWSISELGAGESATLTITGKAQGFFDVPNTAQVTDVDQFDPDSTPNNFQPSEDDQDSAVVDINPAELSVTKTVDKPIATFGSNITFTVNVTNAGPSNATNVFAFD